jgi:hypothetical protein
MSIRKDLGRSRALRPSAESLEVRQLLSATVSGTDTAGDQWTLTLLGKGALQVIKQNDSTGNPGALNSATEIKSITISGTDPHSSRLIGTVVKAAGSDGRVFFNNLNEIPNHSDLLAGGLGILAINMPNFWLGDTGTTKATTASVVAEINIPDGVNSLRFGGVDATKFFGSDPTAAPSGDGQTDQFLVKLGLPQAIGTSIVVDKVISTAQAGTTTGTTTPATQKSVYFDVSGRINLFQANEIDGNGPNAVPAVGFNGGTIVGSFSDPAAGITGELGFVRVGGNATNFSVVTNDSLANMYIGGETNNVASLTPNGARNFFFGKGFDTTTILTHSIENLYANRGALNSSITSERQIGDLMIGGDVANTTVLSGYQFPIVSTSPTLAGLLSLSSTVESSLAGISSTAVTIPTPTAQANGQITAFIAGNVTNSVFAASVLPISQLMSPTTQTFGNPQDALLPLGKIIARVEGTVDNSTATPTSPTTAFYSKTVQLTHGVVVPPRIVEPPLPAPATPITLPGIPHVFPASTSTATTSTGRRSSGATGSLKGLAVTGSVTPKAPKVKT